MKISLIQKEHLRDLLASKPNLRSGKLTSSFTRKDATKEWQQIASLLNAMPGANKDWKAWRKTWQDLQSRIKSKTATINRARRQTGGGPPPPELDQFEEGVAALLHPYSISGHSDSTESAVYQDYSNTFEPEIIYDEIIPYAVPDAAAAASIPSDWDHTYISCEPVGPSSSLPPPPPGFEDLSLPLNTPTPAETLPQTAQRKKTKVNLKTLLKEKNSLKREIFEEKKKFNKAFIEIMERQTKAFEEINEKISHLIK